MSTTPTIQEAKKLAEKYLTETKNHCYQVAQVMQHFAKKLWEDENLRYIVGLLHDIDRDHIRKKTEKHLKENFDKIVDEINLDKTIRDDIKSHGYRLTGIQPDTRIRKYLVSIDELTGFMNAYSLMRPTRFNGMKASSVKKKIKDKSFAAWVDREQVKNCEKYLEQDLGEFISEVIIPLKKYQNYVT